MVHIKAPHFLPAALDFRRYSSYFVLFRILLDRAKGALRQTGELWPFAKAGGQTEDVKTTAPHHLQPQDVVKP
jgi:hypothetical protein